MESLIKIKKEFDYDLKNEWEDLQKNSNINFFQTFKWQKYWSQKCGNNIENIITLFYKNGELVSILPLNIKKKKFIKILNWNGFPFSDYNQPIIKNNQKLKSEDFKFIISQIYLNYKFDNVHLLNCINGDYLKDNKFASNKLSKLIFFKDETDSKIIQNLNKKINYEENRLKKNFKYEQYVDTKKNKKEIIDFFIIEKNKQLIRTRAWNYLKFEQYKKYIYDLIEFDEKNLCFSCLKINDKIISSHIGYKFNKNYYYIFPVYDLDYKKYSPGNILLYKLIENYRLKKFYTFDFTIGNELYKNKLNNFIENIYEYITYKSFLGFFYYIKIKLKMFIKMLFFKKNL